MKKRNVIMLAALCLLAVSCAKDIRNLRNAGREKEDSIKGDRVSMTLEPVVFDEKGTRTQADVDEITGLHISWSENDTVGVYSPEGGFSRFTLSGEGGSRHASFTGQGFSLKPGSLYSAMYPYDGGKSDPSNVSVNYLPRKVSGPDKVEDILPFDLMYASAEANEEGGAVFNFKHLSAFSRLSVSLPEPGTFSSLELMPTYDVIADEGSIDLATGIWSPSNGRNVTTIPLEGISTSEKNQEVRMWLPFAPQDFRGNDIAALMRDDKGTLYSGRLEGKDLKGGKAYRWTSSMRKYTEAKTASLALNELSEKILSIGITGQYSAITRISDSRYAVVHDSKKGGGIIYLDFTVSNDGSIKSVSYEIPEGTLNSTVSREPEGIAYVPDRNILFVAGEGDQRILGYNMDGTLSGDEIQVPKDMGRDQSVGNAGFESLAYNANTGLFWTTTENTIDRDKSYDDTGRFLLRLQSFNSDLSAGKRYFYLTDKPNKDKSTASIYAFGVSDILAMDDGTLLIMEREAHIPNGGTIEMGLYTVVYIKLYQVDPVHDNGGILSKSLVWSKTYNSALSFSNYEGIGLGPVINGKQTILMICDSQDNYKGLLPDKIKVLAIK